MKSCVHFFGGPTASGKTAMAIKLAKELDGEVISADSRQIYIGMDIGTAKAGIRTKIPTSNLEDLYKVPIFVEGIPHYLIDIVYPNQRYTLFDFKKQAYELIEDILARGKTPIVAGGTGLYIDCLINNYQLADAQTEDPILKLELEKEAQKIGTQAMWQKLNQLNPTEAKKIHPNNIYSIIRAIEFTTLNNGEAKSEKARKSKPPFEWELQVIEIDRQTLYQQIETRIDEQISCGIVQETEKLIAQYGQELPALTSIGYKEINSYLKGEQDLETAIKLFKQHTRNYAKRQMTWFRRYK